MKTEITQTTNTGECTIDIIYEMHPRLAFSFRDKMSLLEAESFKAGIEFAQQVDQFVRGSRVIATENP